MINYIERKPSNKLLKPYIERYIQVTGTKDISKTIPSQLNKTLVLDFNNTTLYDEYSYETVVVGYHSKPFQLRSRSVVHDKLMIKFSSFGLRVFSTIPMYEINDQFINAEDILGSDITELYVILQTVTSLDKRIDEIEKFLLKKYREPLLTDKMIFELTESIKNNYDKASVHALKKSLPLSVRQVERNFKKSVGVDIGKYIRTVRFEKARQLLESGPLPRLTDVAYTAGYYDQSHFISDFKELTGSIPKKYTFC